MTAFSPKEIERWSKAVVHLEGVYSVTDVPSEVWEGTEHYKRKRARDSTLSVLVNMVRNEQNHAVREALIDRINNAFKFGTRAEPLSLNLAFERGSALFVERAGRRYLLTARHVVTQVFDFDGTKVELGPQQLFVVPSFDTYADSTEFIHAPTLLWPLNVELPESMPAGPRALTDPTNDLAVISLDADRLAEIFADQLEELGYHSVQFEDVASATPRVGSDVFAIGYPDSIARVDSMVTQEHGLEVENVLFKIPRYFPEVTSLPAFVSGRVSLAHTSLRYFWADLSAYPGNSGGPVIQNGKLIGIVSGQATVGLEEGRVALGNNLAAVQGGVRIPLAKVIDVVAIRNILEEQFRREDEWRNQRSEVDP